MRKTAIVEQTYEGMSKGQERSQLSQLLNASDKAQLISQEATKSGSQATLGSLISQPPSSRQRVKSLQASVGQHSLQASIAAKVL